MGIDPIERSQDGGPGEEDREVSQSAERHSPRIGPFDQGGQSDKPLQRLRMTITAAMGGIVVGLIVALTVLAISNRNRLTELTPERFYAAQAQWEQSGPPSYNIRVVVTGRQASTYEVQVRDRTVISALRDGYPLTQQRTWATWSVPGMFGTILSDVRNLEQHQRGTATAATPNVQLRARFEPTYSYPQRYYRSESSRWQANQDVSWEVVEFTIVNSP